MKGENKRRKKRTGGFHAPVSHSLDADSEEPTVVPRRLVPVSEESTVILYTTAKRQTVRMYTMGDTWRKNVRSKSCIEMEQIVHAITTRRRDICQIVLNLTITILGEA